MRLGVVGALLIAALLLGSAAAQPAPARITAVAAEPATAEEGAYVNFTAALDPGDEGSFVHTWDFGDGVTATGIDLLAFRHRYGDDGAYTVTHTIERSDGSDRRSATTNVTVTNIAPELRRIGASHGPIPGFPVTLTASAGDPGDDTLTYTWDFGDGTPPTQASEDRGVVHTYDAAGTYVVSVTVDDGDGGNDTLEFEVVVGDGFGYELSGDVTARPREGASPTLTGLPIERGPDGGGLRFRGDLGRIVAGDPDATDGPGRCLVILSSQSAAPLGHLGDGTSLTFTAALENGLAVGNYPIAIMRNDDTIEWRDPYELELDQPGTFFASLLDVAGGGFDSGPTSYHPTGGTFTIERYDGLRFEASFQLDLEESLNVFQLRAGTRARTAHAFGVIRHDINRVSGRDLDGLSAMAGATFGDAYLCGSSGELNVVSHDVSQGPEGAPAVDAAAPPPPSSSALLPAPTRAGATSKVGLPWRWEPYADGNAKLEFTFDRAMNPDTLNDRTIWLDIPAGIGPGAASFEPISGIVEAVSDTTYRFLPDWDLRPGVIYEVTIRGGEDGVRGANGEVLEEDYTWRFRTQVELESVVATVTQVSRGAMLVPDKPTVVRVYAFWSGHDDLPPELQALEVAAEVAVEVDGIEVHAPRSVVLKRPDQYGDQERLDAWHTVNFFGWRPTQFGGRSTLTATVELSSEPAATSPRFESRPVTLRHWDRSPTLSLEYYYLEVGSWAGGVPTSTLNDHPQHVQRSADFAMQNLPVAEIDTWWRGPLDIDEPDMEVAPTAAGGRPTCIVPNASFVFTDGVVFPELYAGGHTYSWRLGWELHRATSGSQADVVVGIVPHDVASACGWYGVMVALHGDYATDVRRPRYVLLSENSRITTLAHELGHFYGLCHQDESRVGCLHRFGVSIEGFRIALDGRTGWNKSETEGNAEASHSRLLIPLMRTGDDNPHQNASYQFIADQHYRRLFTTMAQRGVARAPDSTPIRVSTSGNDAWALATASVGAHVSVWALVAPDGRHVAIDRLRPTSGPVIDGSFGAYTVTLVDEAGSVLANVAVDAYAGESVPATPSPSETTATPLAEGVDQPIRALEAVLPFDERAHAVVVALDGREIGRITRSANPPTLDAHLDGTTLHWNAGDADGDPVAVDVDYAPDGLAWVPLAASQPSSGSRSLRSGLEPGSDPVLRVRASDGFDTVERRVPLEAPPTFQIVARSHGVGEALEPYESLWVVMNAPIGVGQDTGTLAALEGPDGRPVDLDARLLPGGRRLLLTPREPLEPGAYRIDVGAAFRAFGAAPPDDAVWQLVVEAAMPDATPEAIEAAAVQPVPAPVAASIPATCGGVDRATVEALLPEGHELQEVADDDACTVRIRIGTAPDRARADLEFALLRQRYLPTRNAQEGAAVVIEFEGNGRAGSLRLEPEGSGTALTLRIAPR